MAMPGVKYEQLKGTPTSPRVCPGKDRPGRRHLSAEHHALASVSDAFRAVLLTLLVLLLATSTGRAQNGPDDDPDSAPGYVNNVFHSSNVDSINLYNGQLTVPVPIGPSYPVGPNLKFQALLTYNARVIENGNPNFQGTTFYQPLVGNPSLGIGWNFQLGKVGWCGSESGICFFRPDGAEINFSQPDGAYLKTTDASRYRLYAPNYPNAAPELWDEDGNHYVFGHLVTGFDDPVGDYIHDFGRGRNGWYLTSLSDPFGNTMTVTYYSGIATPLWAYTPPTACSTMQMLQPPTGGNTWIPQYINMPTGQITVNKDGRGKITSFTFPVHANGASTTRTWTIGYTTVDPYTRYCGGDIFDVYLEEITSIQPPEIGSSYAFTYSGCNASGLLTRLTLPTGATVDYLYEKYSFYHARLSGLGSTCNPSAPVSTASIEVSGLPFCGEGPDLPEVPPDPTDCTNERRYLDQVTGIVRRTETVSGVAAVTDYTQYAFPFGEQGSDTDQRGSQTLTVVLQPKDVNFKRRAKSVLFWASPKSTSTHSTGARTGADIREAIYDCDPNPHGECDTNPPPGLIAQPACGGVNDNLFCPNHAVRVTQRSYEYDNMTEERYNRRLSSETTCHQATASDGTCSGKYHTVGFSLSLGKSWDLTNNRHYNVESHSGNLGLDSRTITTNWLQVSASWLPNLYDRKVACDNLLTDCDGALFKSDRYFEFAPTTGFLKGTFIHDAAGQRIFLTCRYPNADGTPSQDFSATYPGWPTAPAPNACSFYYSSPPALPANGDAFGKIYTHQNGLLTSARWIDGAVGANWKAVDYTRAYSTGWITSSRDSAGLATNYVYDGLGRVTSITPPGEAVTSVSYPSTTQTIATRNGGAGLSIWEQYDYDGLGRSIRERKLMPGSQYVKRFTKYDPLGNANFASEWVTDSTSETVTADTLTNCVFSSGNYSTQRPSSAPGTYSLCYDPFGRPQEVVGSKHSSLTKVDRTDGASYYSDTREAVTSFCVNGTLNTNGSCGAGAVVPNPVTTFLRDAFGRSTSVTEPTGDVTSYSYDVNAKLTLVTQGSQSRSFTYDPAGFLRSETTPEKGTVTYSDYGSLGNLLSETQPGGLVLARTYDFAGRLTVLSSNEGGSRTYLANTFDSSLGRLTSRTGTNYALVPSNTVTDSFAYDSATGRLASRTTTVSGGSNLSTVQSWKYNGLGLLAHHYHPRPSGASPFVVSYGYDAGLPVTQYANGIPMVTGVGYQPSGAVSSYTTGINTGKNVTTTVLLDASLLPRPSQIYATAQATGLRPFDTQSYAYDGAGNIKTIGADTFAYDNRSRLTNATYSGLSSQVYSYDRYGNLLSKGPTNYSVSAFTNRLTSATYDSRGNVTGNGGETYGYDGLDRQTTHTAGGSSWYYLHDGGNERVAKVPPAGGAWTYTFRDEGNRVATEYAGTTVSRDNVFLGSLAVVSYANEAVGGNGAAWTFYSSDHLGTPRLVTDLSGNAIETRKSWPYGEDATTPGAFQRLRFALMERDTEGSKYYDHARSHDFALGRFVSPDKVGGRIVAPQTWNRYAYARSNPLKFVDPDGNVAVGFIGAGNAQDSGVVKIVGLVNNAPGIGRALAVNHESVGNAVKFIQGQHATNPSEAVVLFGHSKGVDSALEVSAALKGKGIKVDLVITIDPVFGDKTAPSNVSRAVNYFQSGMDLGGGQIRPESSSTSVTNVSVPGVGHTTIDEAVVDRSVTQIRSLGASRVPEPAPACGSPEFIGPCGR